MNARRSLFRILAVLVIFVSIVGLPAAVGGIYTDLQVTSWTFENSPDGALVTVSIRNPGPTIKSGLVGVVANAEDGTRVSGNYPVWVPPAPDNRRFVTIRLSKRILNVSNAWVMRLAPPR